MKETITNADESGAISALLQAWMLENRKLRLAWLRAFDCDREAKAMAVAGRITDCEGSAFSFECDESSVGLRLTLPKTATIETEHSYAIVVAVRNGELISLMDIRLHTGELYGGPMASEQLQ
jgi:hypothetical protein